MDKYSGLNSSISCIFASTKVNSRQDKSFNRIVVSKSELLTTIGAEAHKELFSLITIFTPQMLESVSVLFVL